MSDDRHRLRFGLWYDFRNPPQWRQSPNRLYREILDQIVWGENNGFDDVWLSEHPLHRRWVSPVASARRCCERRQHQADPYRVGRAVVDVTAWIAAAVGTTSSRAVRLEGDPRVSVADTTASRRRPCRLNGTRFSSWEAERAESSWPGTWPERDVGPPSSTDGGSAVRVPTSTASRARQRSGARRL